MHAENVLNPNNRDFEEARTVVSHGVNDAHVPAQVPATGNIIRRRKISRILSSRQSAHNQVFRHYCFLCHGAS